MDKSTCSTQILLCVFVYMHMTFIDMNIAHIITYTYLCVLSHTGI